MVGLPPVADPPLSGCSRRLPQVIDHEVVRPVSCRRRLARTLARHGPSCSPTLMRRAVTALCLALAVVAAWQSPAAAHGQGHGELPLEQWQILYAAAAIVVVTWLAGRGTTPRRAWATAPAGR